MIGSFRPAEPRPGVAAVEWTAADCDDRNPLVVRPEAVRPTPYLALKRAVDVAAAVALAVVLLPVWGLAALGVRLTSPGPAHYRQTRLGRFGRPFLILKLRSMRHNCERESGAVWAAKGDRRVTRFGRFLRRLHIDEFPQIWNVLRGDMSLVGPRPERPEFLPVLQAAIPNYIDRLAVRPGVTGLAAVYLSPDEDIASVRRKQKYDVYYMQHMSLSLDLRLVVATAVQAVGCPHRVVRTMLLLPHPDLIEAGHVTPTLVAPDPVSA